MLVLDVATDGTVTITPDDAVVDQEMPVPLRREPVTAPIVLEASSISEEREAPAAAASQGRSRSSSSVTASTRRPPYPSCTWTVARSPAPPPGSPTQSLGVGPVLLDRVEVTEPDASLSPSPSGPTLDYNRPPRLHPAAQPNEFSLPQEPRRPDKMPFPLAMMLMPVLMSGVELRRSPGRRTPCSSPPACR